MMQRLSHLLAAAAVSLLVVGCATTGPQVDPTVTAAISAHGVNSGTYLKIVNARVLDFQDIMNLVQKKVPANIIVGYLQSTRKVYNFTYAQLGQLKSAGATAQLLNYLTETQGFYGTSSPAQKSRGLKEQKDAYYNSPYYQDELPFGYNPPMVDDWYDSAYEESLYSPFSTD